MRKEIKLSNHVLISSENSLIQEISYLHSVLVSFQNTNKNLEQSGTDLLLSLNKTYSFLENFINQFEREIQDLSKEIDFMTEIENNINGPTKLF